MGSSTSWPATRTCRWLGLIWSKISEVNYDQTGAAGYNVRMEVDEINARLRAFYESIWPRLVTKLSGYMDLSCPLLLHASRPYAEANRRLLVVGQQTHGWRGDLMKQATPSPDPRIGELLAKYKSMMYKERQSPFWRVARELHSRLSPGAPADAFLWSNLLKVDQKQKRPHSDVSSIILGYQLLPEEVKIIKPHIVVFFTGRHYDGILQGTFVGAELKQVGNHEVRLLCRVQHAALPYHTYRTYHPKYLVITHQRAAVLTAIEEAARQPEG